MMTDTCRYYLAMAHKIYHDLVMLIIGMVSSLMCEVTLNVMPEIDELETDCTA